MCKAEFRRLHAFYDALCPECAALNYEKRFQSGRPARPRRARHRRARQDRLPRGAQAAARRGHGRRHHALPARRGAALRGGAGLRRLARPAARARPRPAPLAERRDLLQPARPRARAARPARQQRLPDGAPAARLLRAPARRSRSSRSQQLPDAAAAAACARTTTACSCSRSAAAVRATAAARRARRARGLARAAGAGLGLRHSARLSQVRFDFDEDARREDLFPDGALDADLQQVDLRAVNSWRLTLAEVPTPEMIEVQLVNAVAPFILCSRLKPLMLRSAEPRQAHRQRLGDGGHLLARHEDRPPPAHEHGQGRAQHADADLGPRLRRGRHPHERRRHRLDHRRGPVRCTRRASATSSASSRRSTSSTAPRACSTRSSPGLNTGVHAFGQFFKDYKPSSW